MPPNIVFIITDNQSPWTMGCYGNDEILTPNLDRLAGEGVRFDRSYCVNPVCSPDRATYLTGLTPSQHGVHNWLGGEKPDAQMGPDAYCTIQEFVNLPEILTAEGYTCGLSGKWHLGDSLHPQLGYRYWFTKPRGHTPRITDVATPFDGELCSCHRLRRDGIDDLELGFHTGRMVNVLGLSALPTGTEVPLTVTGALLDGTRFEAADCVLLTGPGASPHRNEGGRR